MARCRACRTAETAILVLRVWPEDEGLRARLLSGTGEQQTIVLAQGVDAICEQVRRWLDEL